MKIIRNAAAMQKFSLKMRLKQTIGFVPTMGYLHEGHLSLVQEAKKRTDLVVASIFVNPLQFGPREDFAKYPRDEKSDLAKLKKSGVDVVFIPHVDSMYDENFQTVVDVQKISTGLCGDSRPGHFKGVATVVLKLFNIVQPHVAVFGKKDYQQLAVIKTMARDLNLPVKIIGAPIIRDRDGLAMSSRNVYLSSSERIAALALPRALKAIVQKCHLDKNYSVKEMQKTFFRLAPESSVFRRDYFECRHAETLEPLLRYVKGKTLIAAAVFVGKTRLIDNRVC